MKLIIKESRWSSWAQYCKPIKNELYDLDLNKKYVITRKFSFKEEDKYVEEEREIFSFILKEITNDNIIIETLQPMSDSKTGINLMTNKREFLINKNEVLRLTTPTIDAGDIFELKLV